MSSAWSPPSGEGQVQIDCRVVSPVHSVFCLIKLFAGIAAVFCCESGGGGSG